MASKSTPADRSLAYLQAHRDSNYTSLPAEHRQARQDVMAGLRAKDPGVEERALVGSNQHFARPLTSGEREYQRHWQHEEGLDPQDVLQRRKVLQARSQPHQGRRRRATTTTSSSRVRQAKRAARTTHRAATAVSPEPVRDTAALLWNLAAGGIGLSLLYLILTRSKGPIAGINLLQKGFRRLLLPNEDILFTPRTSTAVNVAAPSVSLPVGQGPLTPYYQALQNTARRQASDIFSSPLSGGGALVKGAIP